MHDVAPRAPLSPPIPSVQAAGEPVQDHIQVHGLPLGLQVVDDGHHLAALEAHVGNVHYHLVEHGDNTLAKVTS